MFRLWLYASTPARRSRSAWPSLRMPRHAQTSVCGLAALMASVISATRPTSRWEGPRPEATRHTREAPPARPNSAWRLASSVGSQEYLRISASEPRRWEQ